MYYSSVCLLIKDENRYLEEWIQWHLNLGFDHIYIYDNGSKESVQDIVKDNNKITVIDWHGSFENVQEDAYNHFLKHYGKETHWVNFIDSDEFIRLVDSTQKINDFLYQYENYAVVFVSFIEYNANKKIQYEDRPVKERFTEVVHLCDGIYHKDFIQPKYIERMDRHYPCLSGNKNTIFKNKNKNIDLVIIDHYYTKSWEEWCFKIKERGSCDPKFLKHLNEFFVYNPEMTFLRGQNITQKYYAKEEQQC